MNSLEERLKAALDARAATFDAAPQAWLEVQRRTPRPRGRARWLLAAVPVVLIALLVPVLLDGGLDRRAATSAEELYGRLMKGLTAAGEPVVVDDPAQGRPVRLWFARDRTGEPRFCKLVEQASGEPYGDCGQPRPYGQERAGWAEGTTQNDTAPRFLDFGLASADVARVTAVLDDGRRVETEVHRVAGVPWSIWTLQVTLGDTVKTLEVTDGKGRKGMSIPPTSLRSESRRGQPAGLPYGLPDGVTVQPYDYETQGRRLFFFRLGRELGFFELDGKTLVNTQENLAFGVAKAGTVRVEAAYGTGEHATLAARPDPWNLGVAILSGPDYASEEQGVVYTGYDAAGRQLWRESYPPFKPQTRIPAAGPPIGEVVTGPGSARFWFAQGKGFQRGLVLCGSVPGVEARCDSVRPDESGGRSGPGRLDTYLPLPGTSVSFGRAPDGLESVDAVTDDGRRIPGTVVRPRGAPAALFYVRYPLDTRVTGFALRLRGKALEDWWLQGIPWCWDDAQPTAAGQPLPGGVTANLYDGPCLKFVHGVRTLPGSAYQGVTGETLARLLDPAERPVGVAFDRGLWYGIALAGTARVSAELKDGTELSATAVADPWGQGVALYSGELASKTGWDGQDWVSATFTGYRADGSVLWSYRAGKELPRFPF